MLTLKKTELVNDDIICPGDSSEDESTKFDVEEIISSLSDDSLPFNSSFNSVLHADLETSSTSSSSCQFKSEPLEYPSSTSSEIEFKFTSLSYMSVYSRCSCCSSRLREFSGPPKKRILLATGYHHAFNNCQEEEKKVSHIDHLDSDESSRKLVADVSDRTLRRRVSARNLFCPDEGSRSSNNGVGASSCRSSGVRWEVIEEEKRENPNGEDSTWKLARVRQDSNGETVDFEFKCERRNESLSMWGFVRFQCNTFPFIFRNGYKLIPVAVILRLLFNPCCCAIPRSVLHLKKSLVKTSASWEEIRRIETVEICKETKITFGSNLIQLENFVAAFEEIREEITSRHFRKKISKTTAACPWLQIHCDPKLVDVPVKTDVTEVKIEPDSRQDYQYDL